MKFRFLILFTILVFALQASAQDDELIGYEHQGVRYGETLPNGFKDMGGGLLSDEDYGITRFKKGKKYYLWFEKISGRDSEGVPSWVVLDVLAFQKLKKKQAFLFSYSSPCTIDGKESLETVVLAEQKRKAKRHKVLKAWRANTDNEKFEMISIAGIECGENF